MTWRAQETVEQCAWANCENGNGAEKSRIAAAREAINSVVQSSSEAATFAFMTFDQRTPPQTTVPTTCNSGQRFFWTEWYGFWEWAQVDTYTDVYGMWRLCDDLNRPYPYLRWDELGEGSVISGNNQTGAIPDSPLISTAEADITNVDNASRRVQWFPEFMGVRAQLNLTTDPDREILYGTVGDYGTSNADRDTEVWGQDFYYWPYVDGFPGYSSYVAWDTDDDNAFWGVVSEDESASDANLYAPFYIDLSTTAVSSDEWGPESIEEAEANVLAFTSPLIEGGVDATGLTPWRSVIGAIPTTTTMSNAPFSHTTVASYLDFTQNVDPNAACTPTTTVLVTDGDPYPESEAGSGLYSRLADLRNELGVKTYVVGFFLATSSLNSMACAAAGACASGTCTTPCSDEPADEWDTCADPEDATNNCAWLADSPEALAEVLTAIISNELALDVASGPVETINDFGLGAGGVVGDGEIQQTQVRAYTEWPDWKGHVLREACDDPDPDDPDALADYCVDQPFEDWETEETFGPCDLSRTWDAGTCLQLTNWNDRRLYSYTEDGTVYRLSEDDGTASETFVDELEALGIVSGPNSETDADAIAAFILGQGWPDDWKLPGLANAAPVVIRRIPRYNSGFTPTVSIRDPHCGGRTLSEVSSGGLPDSLEDFARDAWDTDLQLEDPSTHYEYQEAVVIGDDLGVIHAFQLNSGNELWGLLPRHFLTSAAAQSENGASSAGQPDELEDHIYGVAATINHGWVFDDTDSDVGNHRWRHLGIIGMGVGGQEYIALELSHMSPGSPEGPVEVLWTTEDTDLADDYDNYLGETWTRPALAYEVVGDVLTIEPDPWLILGSGYASDPATHASQGRTLLKINALTGEIDEAAVLPDISADVYEASFGALVDPAVASHCISRFWAEMQEVYIVDPSGRLFRWDQGGDHEADSGDVWEGQAAAVARFPACTSTGSTCTVSDDNAGDVFVFGPAVTANDRIDDPGGDVSGSLPGGEDQFLVALVSGSAYEDTIDGGDANNDFHSSLYLLVDDHSAPGDEHTGFAIPEGAPKSDVNAVGDNASYMRLALSDIERTRTFTPFEGSATYSETANFSKAARPVRAPRIQVAGVVDEDSVASVGGAVVLDDIEVFYITYTIYEPGTGECDPRFYDRANSQWILDAGATYEITFRLTATTSSGFDFTDGASDSGTADFGDDFATGLVLQSVEQVTEGDCADGNCGPNPSTNPPTPCDRNTESSSETATMGVPMTVAQISGFSPIE